jgi:hypothetical protein
MMVDTCLNAGLQVATGDYIWYQSDDDLIADDYAEKMVALFKNDTDCTTAAGLPISIDYDGNIIEAEPRRSNFRPRYMPGRELALGVVRGNKKLFSAPGTIFTIKREALIKAGGYHRCVEMSQLFGIAPFGVSGFDETAHFYWRRHEGQLNKILNEDGAMAVGIDYHASLLKEWDIGGRWQVLGPEEANEIVYYIDAIIHRSAAACFSTNLLDCRIRSASRILQKAWHNSIFWSELPSFFFRSLMQRFMRVARWVTPAPIRRLLKSLL